MDDDNVIKLPPRIVGEAGGLVDESSATLCIYGEELDPEKITKILKTKPTTSFSKGFRKGERSRPSPHGAWLLRIEGVTPDGPEEHLKNILMRIPEDTTIWKNINREYRTRISVGIHMAGWNKGFSLSPDLLARVADLGLLLDFDIYSCSDDDE